MAKHAGAARVGLTLSYMEDEVTLDVRDDGAGFADRAQRAPGRRDPAAGGFGLMACGSGSALAGTLEVESEPGGGHRDLGQPARIAPGEGRVSPHRSGC